MNEERINQLAHVAIKMANDLMDERDKLRKQAADLLAALKGLQANPNDPRAHRAAMDAIKKAEEL